MRKEEKRNETKQHLKAKGFVQTITTHNFVVYTDTHIRIHICTHCTNYRVLSFFKFLFFSIHDRFLFLVFLIKTKWFFHQIFSSFLLFFFYFPYFIETNTIMCIFPCDAHRCRDFSCKFDSHRATSRKLAIYRPRRT